MKTGLLSDAERRILEYYLETGLRLDGLSALIFKFENTNKEIKQDMELIEKVLKKDKKEIYR